MGLFIGLILFLHGFSFSMLLALRTKTFCKSGDAQRHTGGGGEGSIDVLSEPK